MKEVEGNTKKRRKHKMPKQEYFRRKVAKKKVLGRVFVEAT
jgi:hypothetical protein